jgi:hypothetical protein
VGGAVEEDMSQHNVRKPRKCPHCTDPIMATAAEMQAHVRQEDHHGRSGAEPEPRPRMVVTAPRGNEAALLLTALALAGMRRRP